MLMAQKFGVKTKLQSEPPARWLQGTWLAEYKHTIITIEVIFEICVDIIWDR
jgi:hypothetical protein